MAFITIFIHSFDYQPALQLQLAQLPIAASVFQIDIFAYNPFNCLIESPHARSLLYLISNFNYPSENPNLFLSPHFNIKNNESRFHPHFPKT